MLTDLQLFPRGFYMSGAVALARALLGALLVCESEDGLTAGRITETEAYAGYTDAACHSYGRTRKRDRHRTDIMFERGGYAYIYLIYGIHNCFNVVANAPGEAEAVLIRALEPTEGVDIMSRRRGTDDIEKLCSGPGKLCMALGITLADYGTDLCSAGRLYIARDKDISDDSVLSTPRINVDYSGEAASYPYRFVIAGSRFLSVKTLPYKA